MNGLEIEFLYGGKKDFDDFLSGISSEDNVGILSDADFDGTASAVFLTEIVKKNEFNLAGVMLKRINQNNAQEVYDFIEEKKITKLLIADMAADNYPEISSKLGELVDFLEIDHHVMNEEIKGKDKIIKSRDYDSAAATTYFLGEKFISPMYRDLVYGALIEDKCYLEEWHADLLRSVFPEIKIDDIYSSKIGNWARNISFALNYYKDNPNFVYEKILDWDFEEINKIANMVKEDFDFWIDKFEKEKEFVEKRNLYFFHAEPKEVSVSALSTALSEKYPDKTILIYHSMNEGFYKFSIRNQAGGVDVNKYARELVKDFPKSNAGGHVNASGGAFPKEYLSQFEKRVRE